MLERLRMTRRDEERYTSSPLLGLKSRRVLSWDRTETVGTGVPHTVKLSPVRTRKSKLEGSWVVQYLRCRGPKSGHK